MSKVVSQLGTIGLISALVFQGCATSKTVPVARTVGPCVGGEGGIIEKTFRVNVEGTQWADRVTSPAHESIPKSELSRLESLAFIRPQIKFLLVNLTIVNIGKEPLAWSLPRRYVHGYRIESPEGRQYDLNQQTSSMIAKTGRNLNPGVPVKGTVVFDVPQGRYRFLVLQERDLGLFGVRTAPVFQCSID